MVQHNEIDHTGVTGVSAGTLVDIEVATCSGAVTLTNANQDVTGATLSITPTVAELWEVTAIFDFRWTTAEAGQACVGGVDYDGADQAGNAILQGTVLGRATVVQVYEISVTAAAHTIKLEALRTQGGSPGVAQAQTQSRIVVKRFVAP